MRIPRIRVAHSSSPAGATYHRFVYSFKKEIFVGADKSLESAYVIRRAELNHRALSEGQLPWSIRQSAVYYCSYGSIVGSNYSRLKSTVLLVSPSKLIDRKVSLLLEKALMEQEAANPCVLHSLIVEESVRGWSGYISWLEKHLKDMVSISLGFRLNCLLLNYDSVRQNYLRRP